MKHQRRNNKLKINIFLYEPDSNYGYAIKMTLYIQIYVGIFFFWGMG